MSEQQEPAEETKTCPFCGNVPSVRYSKDNSFWIVSCTECDISPTARMAYRDAAIRLWNQRERSDQRIYDSEQPTLRDQFAMAALATFGRFEPAENQAATAYAIADAMLAKRLAKEKP